MSEKPAHTKYQHLVQLANDISHLFQSETNREVVVSSVAKHIGSFWVPRKTVKMDASGELIAMDRRPESDPTTR